MRPPWPDRLPPGPRLAVDALAGAGYGAVVWVLFAHKITPWPLAVAGTLLVAVAVAAGRRWPVTALAAALVGFWLAPLASVLPFLAVAPAGYALYRLAAGRPFRTALAALAAGLTGPTAIGLTGHAGGVVPYAGAMILAWTAGLARGAQLRYSAGLLEAERERASRVAAEERVGIARELHDILAHSLSVITVQAGYGRLVDDPATARDALAAIETTGRSALGEMRQLLGVLRDDDAAPYSPTAGLADLGRLAGDCGLDVALTVTGEPRPLPAGVELAAYRIVQEALTNAVKHAGPARVAVAVGYAPDRLRVEIVDDGRGGPAAPGGMGITGMRERAHLLGGRFDAGPGTGGGFRVAADLPA